MGGKSHDGGFCVFTTANGLPITTIFRRKYPLVLFGIIITIRPAKIRSITEPEKFLGRNFGTGLLIIYFRKQTGQHIPAMLYNVDMAIQRIGFQRDSIPDPRGKPVIILLLGL